MATIDILRTGFSRQIAPGFEQAACTITLIRAAHTNIVVDTGTPTDRAVLELALAETGLTTEEIHSVVCTHGHADHIGNNNLFPGALIVVSQNVTKGDLFLSHDWNAGPLVLDDDVTVELAPGHTLKHNVVWVETEDGLVTVAGDTFVREQDEDAREVWLSYSELPDQHLETAPANPRTRGPDRPRPRPPVPRQVTRGFARSRCRDRL
jgi:glyoxylase-like metal-dependent hydrolase (beta-lactamase superfamily II)